MTPVTQASQSFAGQVLVLFSGQGANAVCAFTKGAEQKASPVRTGVEIFSIFWDRLVVLTPSTNAFNKCCHSFTAKDAQVQVTMQSL